MAQESRKTKILGAATGNAQVPNVDNLADETTS